MGEWKQETEWVWCPASGRWYAIFARPCGTVGFEQRVESFDGDAPPRECWRPLPRLEPIKLRSNGSALCSIVASCEAGEQISIAEVEMRDSGEKARIVCVLSLESARTLRDWLAAAIERMGDTP